MPELDMPILMDDLASLEPLVAHLILQILKYLKGITHMKQSIIIYMVTAPASFSGTTI